MFIENGAQTHVFGIRLKLGKKQDRKTDPYIYIGMSSDKKVKAYLDYFKNKVDPENDSDNHNEVHDRLNHDDSEKFYVSLISRLKYNPVKTRPKIVKLQKDLNVQIPYPEEKN